MKHYIYGGVITSTATGATTVTGAPPERLITEKFAEELFFQKQGLEQEIIRLKEQYDEAKESAWSKDIQRAKDIIASRNKQKWELADHLRAMETRHGARFYQAAHEIGLKEQTVYNMLSTVNRFSAQNRIYNLSFGHYEAVKSTTRFDSEQADWLLYNAEQNGWSVSQMMKQANIRYGASGTTGDDVDVEWLLPNIERALGGKFTLEIRGNLQNLCPVGSDFSEGEYLCLTSKKQIFVLCKGPETEDTKTEETTSHESGSDFDPDEIEAELRRLDEEEEEE